MYSVALEIPWRRHTSSVFAPASCSRSTPMICSSLKRLPFIARLLSVDGLYLIFGGALGVQATQFFEGFFLTLFEYLSQRRVGPPSVLSAFSPHAAFRFGSTRRRHAW